MRGIGEVGDTVDRVQWGYRRIHVLLRREGRVKFRHRGLRWVSVCAGRES